MNLENAETEQLILQFPDSAATGVPTLPHHRRGHLLLSVLQLCGLQGADPRQLRDLLSTQIRPSLGHPDSHCGWPEVGSKGKVVGKRMKEASGSPHLRGPLAVVGCFYDIFKISILSLSRYDCSFRADAPCVPSCHVTSECTQAFLESS